MRDFAPEIFSKVRTLCARIRSKGSPIFPERMRALSFALVPPLFSFAAIFALSFTPYCAVSCAVCVALRAFASGAALAAGISDAVMLYASFVFQR